MTAKTRATLARRLAAPDAAPSDDERTPMKVEFLPTTPDHVEFVFAHRQDPETQRYNPLAPVTVEALAERLAKSGSDWSAFDRTESFHWIVRVDGTLAGLASLQNINRMMRTADIGYGIVSNLRGRGMATAAVDSLARQAFARTDLRKLIAYVHEANLPSQRVLERVGFQREGLLREHFLIGGEPVNEVLYGLLPGDLR